MCNTSILIGWTLVVHIISFVSREQPEAPLKVFHWTGILLTAARMWGYLCLKLCLKITHLSFNPNTTYNLGIVFGENDIAVIQKGVQTLYILLDSPSVCRSVYQSVYLLVLLVFIRKKKKKKKKKAPKKDPKCRCNTHWFTGNMDNLNTFIKTDFL